ncbi:MAG: DNA/RNA non-specific endonuclease [Lachnospiraceae bacterium]|jgi:DNA-entry nuclease|nr:DNA/RNA non-specific endonuclease [Lachnospiraceae bacterium]
MAAKKRHLKSPLLTLIFAAAALVFGLGYPALQSKAPAVETASSPFPAPAVLLEDQIPGGIPEYSGSPYITVRDNVPNFSDKERSLVFSEPEGVCESYSQLDDLGRCGPAFACIGIPLMPTEERDSIGNVRPTGWHTVKYDHISGNYLYNRCHLIGYQLSGENANERNLITGTRYLNVEGMLPFENEIADYVLFTENHVLYRVTPVFEGDNLVASGVLLEAESIEDDEISFCVFCYNIQPGVTIDYRTGDSTLLDHSSV